MPIRPMRSQRGMAEVKHSLRTVLMKDSANARGQETDRVKQYLLRSSNPWTVGSIDISLLS